jgi:uncharacterized protein YndB with AHSA1/START domain
VRFEAQIDIDRPPEDVFAALTDVARLPQWQRSVVSAELEGEPRVGARLREKRKLMGREVNLVSEVTEYDPPHRFSLRSVEGPIPITVVHVLEPSGGGTRLEVVGEGTPKGVMRLAAGTMQNSVESEFRGDLERFRALLEQR